MEVRILVGYYECLKLFGWKSRGSKQKISLTCICFSNPGYESSFTERHRVSAPRTSFFTLSAAGHWGWAFCIGSSIARRIYEMRLLFDDESVNYVRNCSFYIEPVDNCTQPKYVAVKEKPKNETKKPTGRTIYSMF